MDHERTYQRIYAIVRQIPAGQVATYGQLAAIVGNCTPRMVGYAMSALPMSTLHGAHEVPWQRVINAQGKISPRGDSGSSEEQRLRLADEGIVFGRSGRIDLRRYRWPGPDWEWLLAHGYDPGALWREE